MFSGIIEGKARILEIDGGTFTIEKIFETSEPLHIGQSIAHDGACMTITEILDTSYRFFSMEESLARTHFSTKVVGNTFNVERCLRYGDRVDGHLVSGHIDTTGRVENIIDRSDGSRVIFFSFPPQLTSLIIDKGSIAINGASLTVVDVSWDVFSVSLIPLTLELTNLADLIVGSVVNLEFDMMAKYTEKSQKGSQIRNS